ncbi:MAG TPA: HTH domain-containing protein [Candidatus Andersenbacteria bacterium]|nr:HTH domain-containing protein [Candidatus Andersenbacteria bacterium]
MINFSQTAEDALQRLDARSRDIIVRRFGIQKEEKETLESIGKEYRITRERVRQIEANAKKELTAMQDLLGGVELFLAEIFAEHGGLMAESHVVAVVEERTGMKTDPHTIHFFLTILPSFTTVPPNSLFETHWQHPTSLHDNIEKIVVMAMDVLKKNNAPIPLEQLVNIIRAQAQGTPVPDTHIHAALHASKNISPTAFGDWGLIGWAETSPRGVGDKAFAVLRRHAKPAHFREITEMINAAGFDHKKANPQTVHNELIKDGRFVLVGRGLYGLKEWGFIAGTVADVLTSILKESGKPMSKDDLVQSVLKQRMVKKNTILLSLQNNKKFKKTEHDLYALA